MLLLLLLLLLVVVLLLLLLLLLFLRLAAPKCDGNHASKIAINSPSNHLPPPTKFRLVMAGDSMAVVPPPPLVLPQGGRWGTVTCSTQNFSLQLIVLLWQNHHPRVLPKAFQWKVVSMWKSSRSSGGGPRKFTPSWSRSRSQYIGSPLNVSYAEFFRFMLQFLCLQMCVYGSSAIPQAGVGDGHLVTVPQGVVGDCLPWVGKDNGGGGG